MDSSLFAFLSSFFPQLLYQLPLIAVCVTAIALLAGRRAQNPEATGWAIAGFAASAALSVFFPLVYGVINLATTRGEVSYSSIAWVYPVIGVLSSLLHAGVLALLLLAFLRLLRPAAPATQQPR